MREAVLCSEGVFELPYKHSVYKEEYLCHDIINRRITVIVVD